MMIDSVLEFVNKTASNSLFMFLFCNFIIIMILMGSSKPGFEDKSNPGSHEPLLISETVLSSKPGFKKSVLLSDSVLSSNPGFEKPVSTSESVLSSKPVVVSESVLSSNPGFEKSLLISEPSSLTSKTGLQEPVLTNKSVLSSKPVGSEESLTYKPGLRIMSSGLKPGSDFSEKDKEERRVKKTESLEENESDVECVLRTRVEEFIRKVNTQWKSENTKSNYLLY